MLRDIGQLQRRLRDVDLVINDSFHPALLYMGMLPGWRRKVVHVYGASLKVALINNFAGMWPRPFARLFGWIVDRQIKQPAPASSMTSPTLSTTQTPQRCFACQPR